MSENKPSLNDALAAEINAQRVGASLTQAELALASGVKIDTLKNVLAGVHNINVTQIAKLAPCFGLTMQELLELAEGRLVRMSAAWEMMPAQLEDRDQEQIAAQGLSEETGGDEPPTP